jgi:L,D-peptidoglycan transpeptidase YkuD (ErfK/YbiS/YcfS/YnhG family)
MFKHEIRRRYEMALKRKSLFVAIRMYRELKDIDVHAIWCSTVTMKEYNREINNCYTTPEEMVKNAIAINSNPKEKKRNAR